MNKERRKQLYDATSLLDDAIAVIQDIYAEEEEAFDSLNEGLQCGKTGGSMQEAMATLESFEDKLDAVRMEIERYAGGKKKKKKFC